MSQAAAISAGVKSAAVKSEYALELLDAHKSFGKTQIIRGATLQVKPGETKTAAVKFK